MLAVTFGAEINERAYERPVCVTPVADAECSFFSYAWTIVAAIGTGLRTVFVMATQAPLVIVLLPYQ